ncbi:MAG: mshA 3 [Clostridiales bacterium]|nr:mshA 3 [Clostridiales bacterium]
MKIGVDARFLAATKSGVGYYVSSILEQLAEIDKKNEYYLYSNCSLGNIFSNSRFPNFHHRIAESSYANWWLQMIVPGLLEQDEIDVFWGGGFVLPIRGSRVKKVVTIHDFVFARFPDMLPARQVLHLKFGVPVYVSKADHVLVDSESTARDLRQLCNYPADKITVAHLAARETFFTSLTKPQIDNVLLKYKLSPGYLLFVGTIEPRKGVDTILKALALYKQRNGETPNFVAVGQIGWKVKQIPELVKQLGLEANVRFLEYVPDEDLPALYQGAKLLVYPSLYEGFGLPVAEAMASGLPVITSNASSLPEVGGDAAMFVSPGNEEELATALERIRNNPELLNEMVEKGYRQVCRFSWRQTAEKTLAVFNRFS